MSELDDRIVFFEDLTSDESGALRAELQADPALAASFARWQRVREYLRTGLDEDVPDRSLLVLHTLAQTGRAEVLEQDEHDRLATHAPELQRAFEAHPALEDVIARVGQDCATFERCWAMQFDGPEPEAFDERRAPSRPARQHARSRYGWRVAVGVAVVAFAAIFFSVQLRSSDMITVETRAGESKTVTLADGSVVRLQENSTFSYPDPEKAGETRQTRLQGSAFFDVKAGERPFTVETNRAVATVLGTRFGIRAGSSGTQVILASGKLSLAPRKAPDQIVVLQPGEMSAVEGDGGASKPTRVNVARSLEWTGLFVFDSTPLREITRMLAKHYTVIIYIHEDFVDEPVYGEFEQTRPVREVLDTIAASLGGHVMENGRNVFTLLPDEK